jgi:hypothetical protein
MAWRRQTHPPGAEVNPTHETCIRDGGTGAGLPSVGIKTVMDDPPLPKNSQLDREVRDVGNP